jgi:hypothetical protein
MKTSAPVIRVSADRVRDSASSLSSWLDSVQVRPLAESESSAPRRSRREGADRGSDVAAPLNQLLSFKIL